MRMTSFVIACALLIFAVVLCGGATFLAEKSSELPAIRGSFKSEHTNICLQVIHQNFS